MKNLLLHGDVYAALKKVPPESVKLAVTSPPYWKQRDYGFEGQIGQERTPEDYIGRLVAIFDLLRDKLTPDGVFFLNVGDKYLPKYGKSHLLQIPYRLAGEMVRRGWYLQDIIIWYKINHMPSPARDRFTNTYEPVLVLSKSGNSAYRGGSSVIKVRLEQTPWKHTAIFPGGLVRELIRRVRLGEGDVVLDPFAGTGTVAAVLEGMGIEAKWIMIERGEEFVEIIRHRVGERNFEEVRVGEESYRWEPAGNVDLPAVDPVVLRSDPRGEIHVASNSSDFASVLRGMTTEEFLSSHREDALFLLGIRKWELGDLCLPSAMLKYGYVLRNMVVVSQGGKWFPIFVMARDTKRISYRFNLDALRAPPKTEERYRADPIGMEVSDSVSKVRRRGTIAKVLSRYEDGFVREVEVEWSDGSLTKEFVLHPRSEARVELRCPLCGAPLEFDPLNGRCPNCGSQLWTSVETLPELEVEVTPPTSPVRLVRGANGSVNSKFSGLERINWGASPGARKIVIGDYFVRGRLFKVDQPIAALYLNVLRRERGLRVRDVVDAFSSSYRHTVGHWFRRDFGGSLPLMEDLEALRRLLGPHEIFDVLGRTCLRYSTVRPHPKGRNPGDYLEMSEGEAVEYLGRLFR
ncbi:MAG: DNA methyltransferase [Candidatus Korarchaeota archaeon]|nr:DNA methyltransferase [Candidatus Korarchaeota archaeon]